MASLPKEGNSETSKMQGKFELSQATEENVLTYLAALLYEQKPRQLALERGITLAPIPTEHFDPKDPAANSSVLNVDFNNEDPSPLNANFLASTSG